MKVSNIKCKLKHYISTVVICESYMFEFNNNKKIKKEYNKGGGSKESSGTLYQIVKKLKINVEQGGNNTKYNQTLNFTFSVVCPARISVSIMIVESQAGKFLFERGSSPRLQTPGC